MLVGCLSDGWTPSQPSESRGCTDIQLMMMIIIIIISYYYFKKWWCFEDWATPRVAMMKRKAHVTHKLKPRAQGKTAYLLWSSSSDDVVIVMKHHWKGVCVCVSDCVCMCVSVCSWVQTRQIRTAAEKQRKSDRVCQEPLCTFQYHHMPLSA